MLEKPGMRSAYEWMAIDRISNIDVCKSQWLVILIPKATPWRIFLFLWSNRSTGRRQTSQCKRTLLDSDSLIAGPRWTEPWSIDHWIGMMALLTRLRRNRSSWSSSSQTNILLCRHFKITFWTEFLCWDDTISQQTLSQGRRNSPGWSGNGLGTFPLSLSAHAQFRML